MPLPKKAIILKLESDGSETENKMHIFVSAAPCTRSCLLNGIVGQLAQQVYQHHLVQ